ncbi:MAG: molybdopterin-dependent oxidoreductase [Deltaproteobacteria bacterium]|nr:molybdopterin-dependent oxidoreductase [Deltaproteobacteria bacterium]
MTPVLHGISILTDSPTVVSARAGALEFLLANHALDCPVCDKAGECELQDMVHKYGPHKGRHTEKKFKFHEKDYALSPVIIKNSNRCVQCIKCARVCREVVGVNVLAAIGRGDHQEETSFFKTQLDCDHCGNCIEVCPVGCFMRLPYRYKARPWDLKGADTVCAYCATGCRMVMEHRDGTVLRARAQYGVGVNSETLCARGRFGFDYINSPERLTTPHVNRYGKLEAATWVEAFDYIKESLMGVSGDEFGGIVSPRYTNEEAYLFQKLVRDVFKSANVDSTSRWEASGVEAFAAAAGMNEGGVSVFDCMEADTVVVIGAQISDENPVTDYIIRRISAARKMNVIIVSPRAMKLDSSANLLLRVAPGAEGAVLNAVALSLVPDKTGGYAQTADIAKDMIDALVAKLKASASVAIIAGTEFLRHPESCAGLGFLKDSLKSSGKKVLILPALDRCNQRGVWEMGAHPGFGPGYAGVEKRGKGTHEMLEAAMDGGITSMYAAGVDIVSMFPDAQFAQKALMRLKFLIVQDTFMTETAKMAHVVLPGATFAEKEGFYTNQEGRAQIIRSLLPPPGKAKRDFDVIKAVGEIFDTGFGPKNPALALDEMRKTNPMYRDASLAFNNKRNVDNKLDIKAALVKAADAAPPSVKCAPAAIAPKDDKYQFALMTGNHLFHSGMLSKRSVSLTGLLNSAVVEICPEDAVFYGLKPGAKVIVKGAHYEAVMTLTVRPGSKRGVAFIAENYQDCPVNRFFKKGAGTPQVAIRPCS